jgi:hypothetical protein
MADLNTDETQEVIIRAGSTSANELEVNTDGSINSRTTSYGPNSAYVRIATNTTTVVKSGAGFLRRIIKTQGGTYTLYDNTSAAGTIIHTNSGTNPQGTIFYDIPFTVGLTIVTTSGPDLVVVYD